MRHTQLINYTLYQTGWFACVLGASWQHPFIGLAIATGLIAIHLSLVPNRAAEIRLVLLTASIGTVIEVGQLAAGTYRFTSGMLVEWLPPLWLLAMWAQFATTFRFSMRRLMDRPQWVAVFGALGGPVAFLAGERLGAVTLLPPLASGLLRLSLTWAVALGILSVVVRRGSPNEQPPRYRFR